MVAWSPEITGWLHSTAQPGKTTEKTKSRKSDRNFQGKNSKL